MLRFYAEAKVAVVCIEKKDDYFDSVGTFAVGEAFAMGKATIVTHMKSMESYVTDGKNGLFVRYKDVEDMRQKIKSLLTNDILRTNLGRNARDFALKNLGADDFARDLAEYLKSNF